MRWRGLEPPRPVRATRPSTLRVYQFRHQRGDGRIVAAPSLTPSGPALPCTNRRSTGGRQMLTERQREIYDFVLSYVDAHGYPPTVREIGEAVGLASPSTVHAHLANLERAGYLRRDPTKPRRSSSSGASDGGGRTVSVPEVARSACSRSSARSRPAGLARGAEHRGPPCRAGAALARRRGVPAPRQGRQHDRGRHPRGRLRRRAAPADAKDGDIVVALAGQDEAADEATVKRFFRENGRVRLQPENAALEPLYPEHVSVLGKVVGVFRRVG